MAVSVPVVVNESVSTLVDVVVIVAGTVTDCVEVVVSVSVSVEVTEAVSMAIEVVVVVAATVTD